MSEILKQQDDYSWLVLDRDGRELAGPFLYPIDAAHWAREELIRRKDCLESGR